MSAPDNSPEMESVAAANSEGGAGRIAAVSRALERLSGWFERLSGRLDTTRRKSDEQAADSVRRVRLALRQLAATGALRAVAIVVLLGGSAYGLAWLALLDRVEMSSRVHVAGDLIGTDKGIMLLSGDPARVTGTASGDNRRMVVHGDRMAVQAAFAGADGAVIGLDQAGGLAHTSSGERTRAHSWADGVRARWRDAVWTLWLRPAGDWLLDRTMAWLPYSVPAPARPRRLGSFSDCADCPEMVLMSDGWVFYRDPSKANALILKKADPDHATSDAPVTLRQWNACVAAGECMSRSGSDTDAPVSASRYEIGLYTIWLSAKTGRAYTSDYLDCAEKLHMLFLQKCVGWQSRSTVTGQVASVVRGGSAEQFAFRVSTGDIGRPGEVAAQRKLQNDIVAALDPASKNDLAGDDRPRLYIHYLVATPDAAALRIADTMRDVNTTYGKLAVPPVEGVQSLPSRSQLRCFTADDCVAARRDLLPRLNGAVPGGVELQDLAARYPATRARPHHYELWISLGSAPGTLRKSPARAS